MFMEEIPPYCVTYQEREICKMLRNKICGLCLRDFQTEFRRCYEVKEQVQVTEEERAEMKEDEDYN